MPLLYDATVQHESRKLYIVSYISVLKIERRRTRYTQNELSIAYSLILIYICFLLSVYFNLHDFNLHFVSLQLTPLEFSSRLNCHHTC